MDLEFKSLLSQAVSKHQIEMQVAEEKELMEERRWLRQYVAGEKSFSDLPGNVQRRIALNTNRMTRAEEKVIKLGGGW